MALLTRFLVVVAIGLCVSPPAYTPPTAVIGVAATGNGQPDLHTPLTVQDVVRGFTAGSAATTGASGTGTLHKGAKADIVVYEKDLYLVPPEDFSATYPKVVATYVGGHKAE